MSLRRCAAATVLTAVTLLGWSVGQVSAGIEPTCVQVNNGDFDGLASSISFRGPWIAGDTIIVHSGEPIEIPLGGSAPTSTQLLIDGVQVDSGGFPATLDYTFPADADHTVLYEVNEAETNATFTATCTSGPPPTTAPPTTSTTTTMPTTTTSTTMPSTTSTSLATTTTSASTTTSMAPTTSAAETTTTAGPTTTTSGETTTTAVSPTTGHATTVVPPPNTGTLPPTGSSGNTNTIGVAVLAVIGGALALMIARRRTA